MVDRKRIDLKGPGGIGLVVLAAGATLGIAAGPGLANHTGLTAGEIHACTKNDGQVRIVVDAECKSSEQAVSWSVQGPKGDPGAPGAAGPARYASIGPSAVERVTRASVRAGPGSVMRNIVPRAGRGVDGARGVTASDAPARPGTRARR